MDKQELLQIRQRMKERKLSGAALARRLGHSPSWVNSCLNGHYPYRYAGEHSKAGLPREIERALWELRIVEESQPCKGEGIYSGQEA